MCEVEKTNIFWWGLIIFGSSLVVLFTSVWYPFAFYNIFPPYYGYYGYTWKYIAPFIFGSSVFLYIGWQMMKSGAKKKKEEKNTPSDPLEHFSFSSNILSMVYDAVFNTDCTQSHLLGKEDAGHTLYISNHCSSGCDNRRCSDCSGD